MGRGLRQRPSLLRGTDSRHRPRGEVSTQDCPLTLGHAAANQGGRWGRLDDGLFFLVGAALRELPRAALILSEAG